MFVSLSAKNTKRRLGMNKKDRKPKIDNGTYPDHYDTFKEQDFFTEKSEYGCNNIRQLGTERVNQNYSLASTIMDF